VIVMTMRSWLLLVSAVLLVPPALAQGVNDSWFGEAVERHLPTDEPLMQWVHDPDALATDASDRLEIREVVEDAPETTKLTDVVPPIHFESGVAEIPDSTVEELARILDQMRHRQNVRLHLVGHADNRPLSARLAAVYGDNAGLSRERAGQVAEHFQNALGLPPEAISYEWAGDSRPVASNATEAGRALNRRVEVEVWYDEIGERVAQQEVLVPREVKRIKVCRMQTVCKLRYVEGHARRARVQNLIAPLHFGADGIEVTPHFVEQVRQALANLSDKQNVMVKFVGYTDEKPLTGRTERIYGTKLGLSKARARRVALAVQESLALPTAAIDSDGRGAAKPIGSNETAEGQALNRRVEVEFWYDDPLQELPDEPQLCPDSPGAELVTIVYDPPWGDLADVQFSGGQPDIPSGYADQLARALADVADRKNARLRFVGYTRNERLDRRTAMVYTDDIGLSAARARRVMEAVGKELELAPSAMEFEGRGYLYSDDVVNAGFVQGDTSHVAVQVVYDELAVLDDYEGVDITRMSRELTPKNPLALNLMRITVDGEPVDDPGRSSSDIQRCTDVALEQTDIQFGFDNLKSTPRLSVAARPERLVVPANASELPPDVRNIRFRMYTNYSYFIDHAEIRIFDHGRSLESDPLAVLDIENDSVAVWQPPMELFQSSGRQLAYVIRAYGQDGNFDETSTRSLWLAAGEPEPPEVGPPAPDDDGPDDTLLSAYGESELATQNIDLSSGTIAVRGRGIPAEHTVWVAGRQVPVDAAGEFVSEEILPQGMHTVEVAVLDQEGNGELFLRDLEFKSNDWFYVGMADMTLSADSSSGPINSMSGDKPLQDPDSSADGRLAFYVNGKFGEEWRLTASADTREAPIQDLFSNFMDKSPDALFRRIDPDYYYPTFGDDSTVEEMTPTMGKFYVKLSQEDNYGMWGNFKVGYMQNELAQVDRGLYGANAHYQSDTTTSFGERRFAADTFVAEPGTIASREEFLGTGGSLYYLQRQDILTGSERVRIEIRDKASGIVTGVVNLTPSLDYDIDYIQGRVLLSEPLSATVDDNLLVRSNALSGNEAYLVVRYEYTPGFDEIDALTAGGQAHYWFGDHVKLGFTSNKSEEDNSDSSLYGADLTLQLSPESWLKLQGAQSEGLVSTELVSDDGGFGFYSYDPLSFESAEAGAYRVDVSTNTGDLLDFSDSRITLYFQELEAGYTAPGLLTITDTTNYGGTLSVPVRDDLEFRAKVDNRTQDNGLKTRAQEYDLTYRWGEHWDLSAGYRWDDRSDDSTIVVPTQREGDRADAVLQLGYNSREDWSSYAFVQETLSSSGNREDNGRVGLGGHYEIFDGLRIMAEVSDGDQGPGGKLGTNYLLSDRTSMYVNYSLENERTDNGLRGSQGEQGNLVAGVKTRFSDSTSVFVEERYQHNTAMTGLTHSTGINLSPSPKMNVGMTADVGTLEDMQTGAETDRRATSITVGFGFEKLQLSSAIEYRDDEMQQLDLTKSTRTTWLFRNNFKYQASPGGRLLGKLNYSNSDSSLGSFYDGGYTEAVLGYAYRPVTHDRLNTLVKYTYFYNFPAYNFPAYNFGTTDQLAQNGTAAEFIQKSHVAAVDVTYDLTPRFSVGGKYAYRLSSVSLDRENEDFFDNNAALYVLRGDWEFRENWEALVETRLLDMTDLDEQRSGLVLAISRYVGDHVKVGLGYSFVDFSDDLTDLDYDEQGVFLNLTGAL
jgi:flagellar motor protein MotB